MSDWLLAVHCGAGRYGSSHEAAYLSLLRSALESAHQVIASSRSAPTATQIAVHLLQCFERSSLTNAGLGSNLTERGQVECEASVVCGETHLVSCCGAVRGVKDPSALALKLLEQNQDCDTNSTFAFGRQPPLVVVGEHARQLARDFGLETATEEEKEVENYQVIDKTREHWNKWYRRFQAKTEETKDEEEFLDTVGAVCMDPMGNVAAALSSGGVAYKVPGRLGLAGCPRMGCNASNAKSASKTRKRKRSGQNKVENAFAIACTGRGEHFIRSNFVGNLTRRLKTSTDLDRGLRKVFHETRTENGGVGIEGGVLAFLSDATEGDKSRRIQLGAAFTTPCMGVGYMQCHASAEAKAKVQILRQPGTRTSISDTDKQELSIHVSFIQFPLPSHGI
ncbi:Threonine aspartase [Phytophthora megakarya]|uniref:Threonine aspartase n=1 Tax=Phytophthora megakarya TaxID=4795 RepID=A0A225VP52_9STRA|nr:Threonine aspartase [Phytophthora megakarya]